MKTGEALSDLPLVKVLQVSRRMAGITLADIAAAVGRDPDTVGCWFAESADKTPPLPFVPKLCAVLGNPLLIEWLFEQYLIESQGLAASLPGAVTERVRMLLLRGNGQLSAALNLTQDVGPTLSRRESRDVAESILLAVSTLAEAAREARGPLPERSRRLRVESKRFALQGEELAAEPGAGWFRRLRRWLAAWIDGGETIRERDEAREAFAVARAEYNKAWAELVEEHERRADEELDVRIREATESAKRVSALSDMLEEAVEILRAVSRWHERAVSVPDSVMDALGFRSRNFLERHGR